MRITNRKYTKNCIKTTTAIITIVVFVALSVLPSFAIPSQTGGTIGGTEYTLYSRPSVGSVNELVTAVQNQIYFTNPMAYGSTFLYPICITIRPLYDQWLITVIVHRGTRNSAPSVEDIPEEWGVAGATLHFDNAGDLYRYDWMIKGSGGLHCQQGVSMNMIDGVYTFKLYKNEQIVYLYRGVGAGLNDQFQFGNATIGSVEKWNNAMSAYDKGLGGGGFTQEDIDNSYDDGYMDGEQTGYLQGAQDGYASGYETGYDEGYDHGYNIGESVGTTQIDIGEIISSVPEGAKSIINGALGFEIFGINVAGTLTALLVVAIVAYVVRKLMSR